MASIPIWQIRWTTGDVLIADHKLEQHNEILIEQGEGKGTYYLSGTVARQYPIENMPTKDGHTIKVRAVPLTVVQEERIET